MHCPRCGAEIVDEEAVFCPRCGETLKSASVEPTTEIDAQREGRQTTQEFEAPVDDRPIDRAVERAQDLAGGTKRTFVLGGWADATAAAGLALLAILVVGAILVVAFKLTSPRFLADAGPLDVITAIVVLALSALGAVVHVEDVQFWALPLGALVAAGAAIAWAAGTILDRRDVPSDARAAVEGAKVGLPLAVICGVVALAFRFTEGDVRVFAGSISALVAGGIWGVLFGALGGLRRRGRLRPRASAWWHRLRNRAPVVAGGSVAGATMLAVGAAAGAAAALLWIIMGLARGSLPSDFGAGDAVSAAIFVVAFLPNAIVILASVGLGAPVQVGAGIAIAGRLHGPVESYSLFDWAGSDPPAAAYLLIAVPLAACIAGGWSARRRTTSPNDFPGVVGIAVAVFAAALLVLAILSRAGLGAGLVRSEGFARVAPDAPLVGALALVWAVLGGALGWMLGHNLPKRGGR